MGSSKYKLVSPGVQIKEIDNSFVSAIEEETGPVVIGRATRGPAMRPVKVSSFSEFIEYFGNNSDNVNVQDVWRENAILGTSYASLAAEASLANKNSLTFIRLLGTEHPEATEEGKAGWKVGSVAATRTGGAYGLFIFPSSSYPVDANGQPVGPLTPEDLVETGTLAAVWYLETGSISLKGRLFSTTDDTQAGTAGLFLSDTDKNFRVQIKDDTGAVVEDATFNFNAASDKFARKVFNTNPTLLNSDLYNNTKNYFLGETFEDFINNSDDLVDLRSSTRLAGVILALKNGTTGDELSSRKLATQNSRTGWFFSQDVGSPSSFEVDNCQKLFRFHSLDSGEWNQSNIKISLSNIKISTNEFDRYGTFDVIVRRINDSDTNMEILEYFNECSLNPNSVNYIAKKIGNKYIQFDTSEGRNIEFGEFDNVSKYIRVEMDENVELGVTTPELLPFGVYGPLKYKNFSFTSGSIGIASGKFTSFTNPTTAYNGAFVLGKDSIADTVNTTTGTVFFGSAGSSIATASVIFPYPRLRKSTLTGTSGNPTNAFFGVFTDDSNNRFASAVRDLVKVFPAGVDSFTPSDSEGTEYAWKFTLDDLKYVAGSTSDVEYVSGSRLAGDSITADSGFEELLDEGFNKFTTLLAGGFDGLNIKEIEPFRNSALLNKTEKTSYAFNSISRAINLLKHPEDVEFSDASIPGLTNSTLTTRLVEVCAERGDALAVIDLENDYIARAENKNPITQRRANVKLAISSLKSRALNSNYGCTYFPWVQVRDSETGLLVNVPPSVVALGAFSYTDRVAGPHIAPAGFNRGSLTVGHSGLAVQNVSYKLLEKERADLYKSNINPIAVLQGEVVIFGQKTLQLRMSALDRINVRRGILKLKKQFSKIASRLVFEQNTTDTWNRFKAQAEPVLRDLKTRLGLEEYKLQLDDSTTTPDLRDRNAIYAKVFLKPIRSAEFFILDFNITNSGAAFGDLV